MRALATAIGFVALIDACQGQECMQFRQPSDADNETGCATSIMQVLPPWVDAHPGWQIVSFRCARDDERGA